MTEIGFLTVDADGSIYVHKEEPLRDNENGLWYLPGGRICEDLQTMGFNLAPEYRVRKWTDKPLKVEVTRDGCKILSVKTID